MCTSEKAGDWPVFVFSAVARSLPCCPSCFLLAAILASRFPAAFIKKLFSRLLTLTFSSTSVTLSFPFKSTFCKVCLSLRSLGTSLKITLSCAFFVSSICRDPFSDSNAGLLCFLSTIKLFTALSVREADFRCLLSFGFFFIMAQIFSGAGGPSSNSKVRLL